MAQTVDAVIACGAFGVMVIVGTAGRAGAVSYVGDSGIVQAGDLGSQGMGRTAHSVAKHQKNGGKYEP